MAKNDVRGSHVAVGTTGVAITGYLTSIIASKWGFTAQDAAAYAGLIVFVGGAAAMAATKWINMALTRWFGTEVTATIDKDFPIALEAVVEHLPIKQPVPPVITQTSPAVSTPTAGA